MTISVTALVGGFMASLPPATDADIAGLRVWASTSSGFTPSDANLKKDVAASQFSSAGTLGLTVQVLGLTTGVTWYLRFAYYDQFSKSSVNYSAELSVTTLKVVAGDMSVAQLSDINANVGALTGGSLAGWTLSATALAFGSGVNTVGMDAGGTNPAFYAGSATPGSAPYRVTKAGHLYASDADITGTMTATTGAIGGWNINATRIYNTHALIDSAGEYISFGATPPTAYGNNVGAWLGVSSVAKMSLYGDANNYLQWDGSKVLAKAANFALDGTGSITASNVSLSGAITATSGTIGGWTASANTLTAGTLTLDAANTRIQCGASSSDYVRVTPSGIVGVSASLGTTFNLPSNGTAPTFSSGIINSTVFNITSAGILETSALAGDGSHAGVRINDVGIKGWGNVSSTPNFFLDASTGKITAVDGTFSGTITGSTITGGVVQTAASGKRIILNESGSNEARFYGDAGAGVELLAQLGLTGSGGIGCGTFGTTTVGNITRALYGASYSASAIEGYSMLGSAIKGFSMGGTGVEGASWTGYGGDFSGNTSRSALHLSPFGTPGNHAEGDMFHSWTTHAPTFYDGSAWRTILHDGGGQTIGGTFAATGGISNVGSNGRTILNNGNSANETKVQAFNAAGSGNAALVFEGYTIEYGRFDTSGNFSVGAHSFTVGSISSTVTGSANYTATITSAASLDAMSKYSDGTSTWYAGINGGWAADGKYRIAKQGVGPLITLDASGNTTLGTSGAGSITAGDSAFSGVTTLRSAGGSGSVLIGPGATSSGYTVDLRDSGSLLHMVGTGNTSGGILMELTSNAYTGAALNILANQAAGSGWTAININADQDGTPVTIFNVDGAGALTAGATTIKGSVGTAETLLSLRTSWSNPSGNKSIIWTDTAPNILGRISLSYSGGVASMGFGSLYNSGVQTADSMTLTPTGLSLAVTLAMGSQEVLTTGGVSVGPITRQTGTGALGTVTIADTCELFIFDANGVTSCTLKMPANPVNGQVCEISTWYTLAGLSHQGNTGQNLGGPLSAAPAGGTGGRWRYMTATGSWVRCDNAV